jgi:HAD superfamily hydrolase (TIGR01549 family)
MSGSLLVRELARELDAGVTDERVERMRKRHGEIFKSLAPKGRPLPGACELLRYLSGQDIAWAIATSGHAENASAALSALNIEARSAVIVTRDQVRSAKPEPDLFLEAAKRLDRLTEEGLVVGDSIWDMMAARRAGATGIGLLSGGYSNAELTEAGATLICDDPADLMLHVEELLAPT